MEMMENIQNVDWKALCERAYQNAVKHGFFENRTKGEELMLIVTELSEAVQADRDNKFANRMLFEKNFDTPQMNPEEHFKHCYDVLMKNTVEDELADTLIRILSYLGYTKTDVDTDYIQGNPVNMVKDFMVGKSFAEQVYTIVFSITREGDLMCVITRLIALAIIHDIDLLWHVEQKMNYNELRPYKHGKKY